VDQWTRRHSRRSRAVLATTVALIATFILGSCGSSAGSGPPQISITQAGDYFDASLPQPAGSSPVSPTRPNIVFVLTDDLSTNLVKYMPHVQQLMRRGMSFTNYTVANSLCCPSRASIFTGEYPHNSGVLANPPPQGGYAAFRDHGDSEHSFAASLHDAGYRTAFAGKYLNGYSPFIHGDHDPRVPPGWSSWSCTP